MKFENPEYLGLMYLEAARHALIKLLEKPFNPTEMRKLRPMLPYCITPDGRIKNRSYAPMGTPPPQGYINCERFPQYRVPEHVCNLRYPEEVWLYNDASIPWHSRYFAEQYLLTLETMFDFEAEAA